MYTYATYYNIDKCGTRNQGTAGHPARCNTPQHPETHCNTLQHTATHCNIGIRTERKRGRENERQTKEEKERE